MAEEFLASPYVHDFYHFEGNAQSLRIVTKLHDFKGNFDGLDLTPATINTILKYTRASNQPKSEKITSKKVGFFRAEEDIFRQITSITGTGENRHPLTFILEAADDIAYLIADMEDAIGKGVLRFAVAKEYLLTVLKEDKTSPHSKKVVKILEMFDVLIFSIKQFFVYLRTMLIYAAKE